MTGTTPSAPHDRAIALAGLGAWTEDVYRDLIAVERGELDQAAFGAKYRRRQAVLVLDGTGFTTTALTAGEVAAFVRIMTVQRLVEPVLRAHGATLVRAFADDLVALFDAPEHALAAAFEAHRRVAAHNAEHAVVPPLGCCAGIGWGDVFAIGPNDAMGDQMNLASKLGEDVAVDGETLLTESAYEALRGRPGTRFERRAGTAALDHVAAFPVDAVTPQVAVDVE
ncbi:MAG: adenylate/guanylate cyclase domain-containing protein [Saccharothrix sp.]|nr:adenylate/guanylate cyclase domain-containing protein [Saccharothrix sp.]